MKIPIVYENADLVIVEKPAGIPTCPVRNGKKSLEEILGGLTACHRLDTDTSGLVVFARNEETYRKMREAFSKDRVEREYIALVEGVLEKPGKIDWPIGPDPKSSKKVKVYKNLREARRAGAQEATTTLTPLSLTHNLDRDRRVPLPQGERGTWLRIQIKGGRRHQIRAHLAAIGHPVIRLHASRIRFTHPRTGETVEARTPEALNRQLGYVTNNRTCAKG